MKRREFLKTSAVAAAALHMTTMGFAADSTYPDAVYPVKGRLEGTTSFLSENDLPKKANKSYPSFYRGNGKKGIADKDALYHYTELVGPKSWVKPGFNDEDMYVGTVYLNPGETYPAHNHPAWEVYYVVEGEADWYVNDEKQRVTPGSVIFHRPYDVHGWKNTSKTKELKLVYIWWSETGREDLGKGARFTNPDLFTSKEKITPHAVPVPRTYKLGEKKEQKNYDSEYPIYGRMDGITAFYHSNVATKKANKSYPAWFRGNARKGLADANSKYWYKELVTPERYAHGNHIAEMLYFGELELMPGQTYAAHNHPSKEWYFMLEGEAIWYVDDEKKAIKAGDFMYHRPQAVHGFTNTTDKPVKLLWAWWGNNGDGTVLDTGARLINPKLVKDPKTVKAHAVPLPKVRKNK